MEISTSEAARQFKTHPNVLLRLILLGRLDARKNQDGHWLISIESLERWDAQRVRRVAVTRNLETVHAGAAA